MKSKLLLYIIGVMIFINLVCAVYADWGIDLETPSTTTTVVNVNGSINLTDYYTKTQTANLFVSRTDWTTIDNYPANCGAGQYVYGIGDTLSCSTPSTYNITYAAWNQTYADTLYSANTTAAIQLQINGTNIDFSNINASSSTIHGNLNVTGTSYLGNLIIDADNITVNNIISKDENISFWNTSGSEIVHFDGNGNVGIGIKDPITVLNIRTPGVNNSNLQFSTSTYGAILQLTNGSDANVLYLKPTNRLALYNYGNNMYFDIYNDTSVKVRMHSNGNSYFNGGNVGIGTKAPGYKLVVEDSDGDTDIEVKDTGADSNVGVRLTNDAREWRILNFGSASDNFVIRDITGTSNPFTIEAATPTDTLYLDSIGNVGIGVTTPSALLDLRPLATTDQVLTISGDINDYNGTGSGSAYNIWVERDLNVGDGNVPKDNYNNVYSIISSEHTNANATDANKYLYSIYGKVVDIGKWSNYGSTDRTITKYGLYGLVDSDSILNASSTGYIQNALYGVRGRVDVDDTVISNGAQNRIYNYGGHFQINNNPTILNGSLLTRNYGIFSRVAGTTVGSSYNYGLYIYEVTGADKNYGIWDNSGADWVLDADNQKIILGKGQDASIYYNGTDMYLDTQEVGSGDLIIPNGNVGIGTTSPSTTFHSNGTITAGTSTNPVNITMFSPDGTSWTCGVNNSGSMVCT